MDSQDSEAGAASRPEDRRRSARFPLDVPVSLKWIGLDGLSAEVEGRAVEGSNHGGLLEIADPPPFGKEAVLTNLSSQKTSMVQVLSLRTTKEGAVRGLAVQFLSPSAEFWGAREAHGMATADLPAEVPDSAQSSLVARCKSLLNTLLGRPRM